MKIKYNYLVFIFIILMGLMSSCQYDTLVKPIIPPPNPSETISFSKDILPIFNDNSNCTSCHYTGGQFPDLTYRHAYSSITDLGLVDLSNPKSSIIYQVPNLENNSSHTWKKYTDVQAQYVLQWIKQGALNN